MFLSSGFEFRLRGQWFSSCIGSSSSTSPLPIHIYPDITTNQIIIFSVVTSSAHVQCIANNLVWCHVNVLEINGIVHISIFISQELLTNVSSNHIYPSSTLYKEYFT